MDDFGCCAFDLDKFDWSVWGNLCLWEKEEDGDVLGAEIKSYD